MFHHDTSVPPQIRWNRTDPLTEIMPNGHPHSGHVRKTKKHGPEEQRDRRRKAREESGPLVRSVVCTAWAARSARRGSHLRILVRGSRSSWPYLSSPHCSWKATTKDRNPKQRFRPPPLWAVANPSLALLPHPPREEASAWGNDERGNLAGAWRGVSLLDRWHGERGARRGKHYWPQKTKHSTAASIGCAIPDSGHG